MDHSQNTFKSNDMAGISIRNFKTSDDINFAAQLTAGEKWHSETEKEVSVLFEYNPSGCFIAEFEGKLAGICIVTIYENFAFIGDLIVSSDRRKMGIGKLLMETVIKVIQSKKIENIFLDGVQKAVPLYQSLGFKHLCRSLRFFGQVPAIDFDNVSQITPADMQQISIIDREVFGDDRSFFLENRIRNYPDICLKLVKQNDIQGYLFARKGVGGLITVGPWVSRLTPKESMILLNSFQYRIGNQPFALGALETNKLFIQSLIQEGMMPDPDHSFRMRLGSQFNPGDDPACFAIGSPAKG